MQNGSDIENTIKVTFYVSKILLPPKIESSLQRIYCRDSYQMIHCVSDLDFLNFSERDLLSKYCDFKLRK